MAHLILNTFPAEPQHVQRVVLGGFRFRVRLTWYPRLQAWYCDVERDDGEVIVAGQRVSPEWGPLFAIPVDDGPGGLIYVRGPDPYNRSDLGGRLIIAFAPEADLPAAVASTDVVILLD